MTRPPPTIGAQRGVTAIMAPAAAVALLTVLLGACTASRETTGAIADYPRDIRQRHPIVIQERDRTVEVFVGSKRGGLTPAQRADVLAFAQSWKREGASGVLLNVPAGTPNERAAAESAREIQSILGAAGVPGQGVATRNYQPEGPERLATIRLSYARIGATAGPCGLWPHDLGMSEHANYRENQQYWNFGCASQRNLAAMVENPADLVQPRGEAPTYAARRSTVLDKYRKGESTATVNPDANQGKISDVGK
jgi:pilus assembly protein CpaD